MTYKELIKLVEKQGFYLHTNRKRHDLYMNKQGKGVYIPRHGSKEVPIGTCKKILKEVGL